MIQRLFFLDGLRAIAAICVMFQHMLENTAANEFYKIISPGLFGVVLFFFISGFIIPYSVGPVIDPDKFTINRIFRIFPAYLTVLGLSLLIGLIGVEPWAAEVTGPRVDAFWFTSNLLMIAEYVGVPPLLGVAWTLPLEFAWYALFGVLFALLNRRFALYLTLGLSLLLLAVSIGGVLSGVKLPIGRLSLVNAASVGYLFYLHHLGQMSGARLSLGASSFALFSLASFIITYGIFPHPNVGLANIVITWGAGFLFFAAVMLSPALRQSRLLTNPIMRRLGEISYSIYLIHGIVLGLLKVNGTPFIAILLLGPLLTFAVSWIVYTYVELPGVTAGKRIFHNLKTRNLVFFNHIFPKAQPTPPTPE